MSIWLSTAFSTLALASFVVATMFLGFSMPLFLFTFAIATLFILQTPIAGLLSTILLTMFFERFFTLTPFVWGDHTYRIYPLDFLFAVTVGAIVLYWLFHSTSLYRRWSLPDLFVLLFILIVSGFTAVGFFTESGDPDLIASAFKNYGLYAVLYFVTRALATDRAAWRMIVQSFLVGGVALLFFIIVGFARGQGLWSEYTPLSTSGYRFLASTHAYYLTIPLLLTLILYAYGRVRETFRVGTLMAVQLFGILGSLMRHIWIASAVAVVATGAAMTSSARRVFMLIVSRIVIIVGVLVALLFVLTLIAPSSRFATVLPRATLPFIERVSSLLHGSQDLSTAWRIDVWRATLQSFSRHPLLGIGFGQDMTFQRENYLMTIDVREIHNSPFAILVQMGLVGFVAFLALLAAVARAWWHAYRQAGENDAPYLLGIGCSALLFFVASLFQPYLETNTTGIFFWILLGLMRTAATTPTDKNSNYLNSKS